MKKNVKNRFTNVLGFMLAVSGSVATMSTQVKIPEWIITTSYITATLSGVLMAWASGKTTDLKTK